MSGSVVVTGAARGIGRAISRELLGRGFSVLLADLDRSVHDTASELGDGLSAVVADVTDPSGRARVADALPRGPLSGLVNNAGITRDAFVVKMSEEDFRAVIRVNLRGAYELTRALVPRMSDGAAVVSMSSRAYLGNMGQYNYSMSKGGLVGMTRALAQEHAPRIRFNAVAPGLIGTDMAMAMPEKVRDKLVARVPLGRMGEPAEVARLVAFLISDASSYVTGQVVVPCGGRSVAP
jgi:NAD(P)-dependent dehydrogenase (short-subunit alcohol dehydrogenase family)